MKGIGKIGWGILAFIVGFGVMISLDPLEWGDMVVYAAWALMALGVLLLLAGIIQMIGGAFGGNAETSDKTDVPVDQNTIVVRSMIAMALADGAIDDSEAKTITRVYQEVTGRTITASQVKELAGRSRSGGKAFFEDLQRGSSQLNDATKAMVIKASYLVLAADGDVTQQEEGRIGDVAMSLKMPYEQAIGLIRDVHHQATVRGRA